MVDHVQKRNPQPPHRDRTLRWRRHLPRRLHPRSSIRPFLRLSGYARHRRGKSPHSLRGNPPRQAPAKENLPSRRARILILRQPNRPRHRPSRGSLSPRLCRQASRNRCRCLRGPALPCLPRHSRTRRCHPAHRRPHRPRRRRRCHRVVQGTHRHRPRKFRRGPERRRSHRAQNPTTFPQPGTHPQNQNLQRLRSRRRLSRHRRDRPVARHQPGCRPEKIRRPRRHRTRHFRVPGTHGRLCRSQGNRLLHRRGRQGKPRVRSRRRRHRLRPPRHDLARQNHRRSKPRIPRHQRRPTNRQSPRGAGILPAAFFR